ncbi:hypothetical protein QLS31_14570 [Flavobacterium sp. XS2P24]|uniref:hypothetical protein n=1 Tax=Flavobacterium sp. XS2P24 TaxID=3041249 RepID=UPI0024A94CBA|nr:hypothetical protein [Flavobacterium sp. XS2P24]MDI6051052.1 hypothetical protein [Flavobacterium sp. XS2P24]
MLWKRYSSYFFHLLSILFAQEAKDVVKKVDEKAKGKSSISSITIQTIRPSWPQKMSVKAWTKGNGLSLILVLAPAKEKGATLFKTKIEKYNYKKSNAVVILLHEVIFYKNNFVSV